MQAFIIEQKVTLMANQYRVFKADEAGEKHEQIGFAHQKRIAIKERFDLYTDDSKQQLLMSITARQVMDFGARYDVRDANGTVVGVIGKAFKSSLLRSTWHMFDPADENKPAVIAQERNKALAIVRRAWEILPYISDIPFFVKYHFDFLRAADNEIIATYNKTTTLRDHYLLRIEGDAPGLDWRAFVALGILMDALQSR